jgi:signal transduction histidine kinase
LALVKRIVELYDGTIRVESAGEGEGTTIFFTLPAAIKSDSDYQAEVRRLKVI